jgi:hypothetical protein
MLIFADINEVLDTVSSNHASWFSNALFDCIQEMLG